MLFSKYFVFFHELGKSGDFIKMKKAKGPIARLGSSIVMKIVFGVVAYLIPAFLSVIAFRKANIEDEKIWLKYWMTVMVFVKIDDMLYKITDHIPFWIFIKIFIILVFQFGYKSVISSVYDNGFKPIYDKIFPKIIKWIKNFEAKTDIEKADLLKMAVKAAA